TASEQIVELAKEVEAAQSDLSEAEMAFAETESKLLQEMKTLREAMAEQEGRRKELEKSREKAAAGVNPSLLKRYDAVLKRRTMVLAPVENGACSGCHMNLPP